MRKGFQSKLARPPQTQQRLPRKGNTCRILADSAGVDFLREMVAAPLALLGTSAAVFEKNGDYVLRVSSSGWCRFLHQASRNLCATDDDREAMESGKWHCYESSWTEASKVSLEKGRPVDIKCRGGIHIYAAPIRAGGKILGSINFGYGDPPKNPQKLSKIAERYGVTVKKLLDHARSYGTRPLFVINIAKKHLITLSEVIGEMVEYRRAEEERKKAAKEIKNLNEDLKRRAVELEAINKELEAFSFSVSHDLHTQLLVIDGFSRALLEKHSSHLNEKGCQFLSIIRANIQNMRQLIDDLLAFSHIGRQEIRLLSDINMSELAQSVFEELNRLDPGREVHLNVETLPPSHGDQSMIRQVFINLLTNAIKFTRPKGAAVIEIGGRSEEDRNIYFIRDNGVGFDMQYANKLFNVFERLHSREEFEGTGVGLAIVQRIIQRHGGCVWAEGRVNEGATFYFTLPTRRPKVPKKEMATAAREGRVAPVENRKAKDT